jgi:hypothetical protein
MACCKIGWRCPDIGIVAEFLEFRQWFGDGFGWGCHRGFHACVGGIIDKNGYFLNGQIGRDGIMNFEMADIGGLSLANIVVSIHPGLGLEELNLGTAEALTLLAIRSTSCT